MVAQTVKNLSAFWETWVQSLGWEDPLEKGTATHSSILAWRIPSTGAWQATVHAVSKNWTWLSDFHFHLEYPVHDRILAFFPFIPYPRSHFLHPISTPHFLTYTSPSLTELRLPSFCSHKCHCTSHVGPLVLLPAMACHQKSTSAFVTGITIASLYCNFLDLEKCISYLFPFSFPSFLLFSLTPLPYSFLEFSHFYNIVLPSSPLCITRFNVAKNR